MPKIVFFQSRCVAGRGKLFFGKTRGREDGKGRNLGEGAFCHTHPQTGLMIRFRVSCTLKNNLRMTAMIIKKVKEKKIFECFPIERIKKRSKK